MTIVEMKCGAYRQLKPMPEPLRYAYGDPSPAVYKNKIGFGTMTHSYDQTTDDTVIPASVTFGDYTSLTVVIRRTVSDTYDISKDAELFAEGGDYAFSACLKLCSASDGSEVVGTTSYGQSWTVTSKQVSEEAEGFEFVTVDAFSKIKQINLVWDHTLEARSIVENAKAIKVVIKLAEPLNGMAFYGMVTAKYEPLYWWQYVDYLARYELDGSSDELVFDISMEKLGDLPEAAVDLDFNIDENIVLWNTNLMSDYMHINRKNIEEQGILSPYGGLSWTDEDDRMYYKGKPINYADGAAADAYGASVRALEAYMEVTVADPVPVNLGDVNGDGNVTLEDAVQTLKRAMNVDVGNEAFIEEAADVVADGKISLEDAIEILKMAMKVTS